MLQYRCIGSALFHKEWGSFAKWTSYNGEDHQYWGGSNKELHCACGITGTFSCLSNFCYISQFDTYGKCIILKKTLAL